MKKKLIKLAVFLVNSAAVLVGVVLIKNYEKNKLADQNGALTDSQAQSSDVGSNFSETSANIQNFNQQKNLETVSNDSASQTIPPATNASSNAAPKTPATSVKVVNPAPVSATSPSSNSSASISTPKTKTS